MNSKVLKNNRTGKSLFNLIFGIISKIVSLIFPFVIKTVIIYKIGAEYIGLNTLFTSILSVLSLTELGIGSAMIFYMYKPLEDKDYTQVGKILNFYKKIYFFIGLIVLIIGLCLMPFLKFLIKGEIPSTINLYILYSVFLIDTLISYFLFAEKKAIIEADQRIGVDNIIITICNTIMYVVQIISLVCIKNYYAYIIFVPINTTIISIVRAIYTKKKYAYIKEEGDLTNEEKKFIFDKVKALIGHKIGTVITLSVDSIVISGFLGLSALTIYSNYYFILNSVLGLVNIIYFSISSSIGNSLIANSKEHNLLLFNNLNYLNSFVIGICAVLLTSLFQPFMKLWVGEELMFEDHMVFLFTLYFVTMVMRKITLTFKDAAGLWKEDWYKPYIGIAFNLILNIVLVNVIGIEGVLISTIVMMLFIYFPIEGFVVFKNIFHTTSKKYFIKQIYVFTSIMLTCFLSFYVCSLIIVQDVAQLFLNAFLAILIFTIVYLISTFWFSETRTILNKLKTFRRKDEKN